MELAETALVANGSCCSPSWWEQEEVVTRKAQRPAGRAPRSLLGFLSGRLWHGWSEAGFGEITSSRELFIEAAPVCQREQV